MSLNDIIMNIRAVFTPIDTDVVNNAKMMQTTLTQVNGEFKTLVSSRSDLHETLRTGLRAVSVLQLTRFALRDIQDLASGKGGLPDMLSLATSLLILANHINMALKSQIALQTISNALALVGMTLTGVSPAMLALLGVTGVTAAYGVARGAAEYGNRNMYEDQRMRMQAYRSVIGQ